VAGGLALAHAEAALSQEQSAGQREPPEGQLADIEQVIGRLTAAIARGGELRSLLAALETHERRRREVAARLEALRAARPTFDPVAVRRTLEGYLVDWQGLLLGHVRQAQQVLRRLVVGRLTFTPNRHGYYTFQGRGTVRPLLAGVVRNLASPSRLATLRNPAFSVGLAFAGAVRLSA